MIQLRLNVWTDREKIAKELIRVDSDLLVDALLRLACNGNSAAEQTIHRLLCQDEDEAKLLYEKSFQELEQREYSWKYPEPFEERLQSLIDNWIHLLSISEKNLGYVTDFYRKIAQILDMGSDSNFLYTIDDIAFSEIQNQLEHKLIDAKGLWEFQLKLKRYNSHGQSEGLQQKITEWIESFEG